MEALPPPSRSLPIIIHYVPTIDNV